MLVAAAAGYLAGTVPSADLAARVAAERAPEGPGAAVDLRAAGSGNPGASNAIALLGPRWGYAVMAGDIAKGALACVLGGRLAGSGGAHVAGVAAVVGHCFPVWSGFRGGKGVATSVGQCAVTFPVWSVLDLGVAAAVAASPRWKERAFSATAVASAMWIVAGVAWWRRGWPNLWGPRPSAALPLAAAASSGVILSRFASARKQARP